MRDNRVHFMCVTRMLLLTAVPLLLAACMSNQTLDSPETDALPAAPSQMAVRLFLDGCVDTYVATGRVRTSFDRSSDFVRKTEGLSGQSLVNTHRRVRLQTSAGDFVGRGYSVCSIAGWMADAPDFERVFQTEVARRYGARVRQMRLRNFGPSLVYLTPDGRRLILRSQKGTGARRMISMNASPTF